MFLFGIMYSHKYTVVGIIVTRRVFRNRIKYYLIDLKETTFVLKVPRRSTSAKLLGLHKSFFPYFF